MWVECIDNDNIEMLLTIGKLYKVVNYEKNSVFLFTDLDIEIQGKIYKVNSHRFNIVPLIEARDRQLKSLGL